MQDSRHGGPFYTDPYATLYLGDALRVLADLPKESAQCVVTSPPFWGLRKYAGEQEVVWGDWKGAYGLEPTPELYIQHSLRMLGAIRRVLRPDGVVFWHLADSYAGSGSPGGDFRDGKGGDEYLRPYNRRGTTLKAKDLCLIPERVMLAAQIDGWWLRSRIAWVKPNAMPDSAADRPTDAWDYIIMLTKAADYYWDQEAVRQPLAKSSWTRYQHAVDTGEKYHPAKHKTDPSGFTQSPMEVLTRAAPGVLERGRANLRNVWTIASAGFGLEMCQECGRIYEPGPFQELPQTGYSHGPEAKWAQNGREMEVPLAQKVCRCGASDFLSHFATFPLELPSKCILAATSEKGNCPRCGKPWERVVEKRPATMNIRVRDAKRGVATAAEGYKASPQEVARYGREEMGETETLGWQPQCSCGLQPEPALVLDPFLGSGTTAVAARHLGRRAIGIDICAAYLKLAQYRLEKESLPLV